MIQSALDIERLALKIGFLPFFRCGIENFSIEENTPEELWFSREQDGPWEWKGPVIVMGSVAYGKFFSGKAGYVSLEWLPDLINYRRARYGGQLTDEEHKILDALIENESLMSYELKRMCGYMAERREKISPLERAYMRANKVRTPSLKARFDALMTRLQMAMYVVIADFEYSYSKSGERYGWGRARYTTPELMYEGIELPNRTPEESLDRIITHLQLVLPDVPIQTIKKLVE